MAAETKVKSFSPVPLSFYDLPSGFQVSGSWSVTDHDTKFRVTFRVFWYGTQIRSAAQRSEAYSKCIAFAYSNYTLDTIGL